MGPFLRSKNKTNKVMINLLIALLPIIIFTIYKNGYVPYINGKISFIQMFNPLLFLLIGSFISFFTELIYALIAKQKAWKKYIKTSYGFFPGLFLALILPLNCPIYVLVIGTVVASLSKIVFGGFGKNIFNPALIGYIFIMVVYSSTFTTTNYLNSYEIDTISSSTPLTNASMVTTLSYDELVKPYGSLMNFFIGTIPGSIAETSALLCLVAFVYLTLTKTIKWRIPVFYVTTVFVITFMIGRFLNQGMYYPMFHILSGGLMFGAIFMATDPVTSCVTPTGQVLQGIFLGILTVIFRFTGVEGVAKSILIVNMFVFILDKIGSKARFNFIKSFIWFLIASVIVIVMSIPLAATKRVIEDKDPNFNIISKEQNDSEINYVVTQKGYGGNIKASVKVKDYKVIEIEILSHHETSDRYQMVIDANYINMIIKNQENLENLDTVSSATVTSNALKKMIINVMEDYN